MAGPARQGVLKARYAEVSRVLWRVFFLNLIVAAAKITLGLSSGAVSILSDGFHSLTDTASNIVALVGVRIASQPPDDDHPYGHRKFETMASVGILIFLLLVLAQVLSAAVARLQSGGAPIITPTTFLIMGGTFLINVGVVVYESPTAKLIQTGPDTTIRLAGDEMVSVQPSRVSLMPPGLLNGLNDGELADFYAFMKTLKK